MRLNAIDKKTLHLLIGKIEKDFTVNYTINDLAAIAHMSSTRLKKAFFIMFQQTVYQFILHKKMAFAFEKFKEDELSLTQIARLCGYKHNSNFIAAFRKVYGYTPASIRPQN